MKAFNQYITEKIKLSNDRFKKTGLFNVADVTDLANSIGTYLCVHQNRYNVCKHLKHNGSLYDFIAGCDPEFLSEFALAFDAKYKCETEDLFDFIYHYDSEITNIVIGVLE